MRTYSLAHVALFVGAFLVASHFAPWVLGFETPMNEAFYWFMVGGVCGILRG